MVESMHLATWVQFIATSLWCSTLSVCESNINCIRV